MEGAAAPPAAPPPRERGWRRLLPALLLFLLVPAVPLARALAPIEQPLLLLVPAVAACALVAWLGGGRGWTAAAWVAAAGWVLAQPLTGSGAYGALARGWALFLAAAFGVIGVAWRERPFLPRALAALALAGGVGGVAAASGGAGPRRIARVMANEVAARVDAVRAEYRQVQQTPLWESLVGGDPARQQAMAEQLELALAAAATASSALFPALLALESLVALALAWAVFHRISRGRAGPPLAPLREFRFSDQLVWGLIAGLVLVVVPSLAALRGVGLNLIVFFGALYVVRGLGVMLWFLAPGPVAGAVLISALVLFAPFMWPVPLGLGLGDTWLDWRRRAARAP